MSRGVALQDVSGNRMQKLRDWLSRMGFESRVNVLTVITSLVVAYVRHGLETKWAPWRGYEHFFAAWLIHYFALLFLVFGAGLAITSWHEVFLGEKRDLIQNRVQFQYYIVMTALIAAIGIFILAVVPFSSSDDY